MCQVFGPEHARTLKNFADWNLSGSTIDFMNDTRHKSNIAWMIEVVLQIKCKKIVFFKKDDSTFLCAIDGAWKAPHQSCGKRKMSPKAVVFEKSAAAKTVNVSKVAWLGVSPEIAEMIKYIPP